MRYVIGVLSVSVALFASGCDKKTNKKQQERRAAPAKTRGAAPPVRRKAASDKELIAKGRKVAMQSFKALSSKLMAAMQKGGPPNALKFCAAQAQPLSDSLGGKLGVKQVARVSHKARNPKNKADTWELKLIADYVAKMKEKKPIKPTLRKEGGKTVFYAPIRIISPACLKCHGEPNKEISKKTFALIKEHYPKDNATGFKFGEMRGLWKITF
ncbi:MAG: hypothetical protein CL920_22760 [Deltaproteobacteria bacterium]|nr:hypothetical protein [Deltaproteobacteria bacterium]|tara:strand:+ start:4388 stop:5026 length:639 start_codon:yes stop_codon:yes gene_type:complete